MDTGIIVEQLKKIGSYENTEAIPPDRHIDLILGYLALLNPGVLSDLNKFGYDLNFIDAKFQYYTTTKINNSDLEVVFWKEYTRFCAGYQEIDLSKMLELLKSGKVLWPILLFCYDKNYFNKKTYSILYKLMNSLDKNTIKGEYFYSDLKDIVNEYERLNYHIRE